jgi:hypothetical protein
LKQNVDEYITIFEKKFKNFCSKSPLILEYMIGGDKVYIVDKSQEEVFKLDYELRFDEDVKIAIKHIKDILVERYPVITQVDVEYYTTEEISKLVKAGEGTIEELSKEVKKGTYHNRYIITKVIDQYNEIILKDMKSGELMLYKVKIPVQLFMKTVFKRDVLETWNLFQSKAEFKKVLIERDS